MDIRISLKAVYKERKDITWISLTFYKYTGSEARKVIQATITVIA